jgi:hypothetical protein
MSFFEYLMNTDFAEIRHRKATDKDVESSKEVGLPFYCDICEGDNPNLVLEVREQGKPYFVPGGQVHTKCFKKIMEKQKEGCKVSAHIEEGQKTL